MKAEIVVVGQAIGRSARQIQQWKSRGHVPHKWRVPMLREAVSRFLPLSESDFEWEKPAEKRQRAASEDSRPGEATAGRRGKGGVFSGVSR